MNLTSYKLKFDLGTPFYPFQQLMGVLPAASKTLLPVPYQARVTSRILYPRTDAQPHRLLCPLT